MLVKPLERCFLSGMGACTSIGMNIDDIWHSVLSGKSGLSVQDGGDSLLANTAIEGDSDRLYRLSKLALSECIDDAGWTMDEAPTALVFAHGAPDIEYLLAATDRYERMGNCRPDAVYRSMNNYVAARLGKEFHIKGPVYAISAACAGSASAIHLATLLLESGTVSRCLCGGGEVISEFTQAAFSSMRSVLTKSPGAGPKAIQPFGIDRSGIALGEGCGWLALSGSPSKSGNHEYTIVSSNLINVPSAIYGDVLDKADWHRLLNTPMLDSCDLVMAHATSTTKGDLAEGNALVKFTDDSSVLSSKYYFGHTLSASTVLDLILACKVMETSTLFSIGHDYEIDNELSSLNIPTSNYRKSINKTAKISAAFGGSLGLQVLQG